MKALLLAAVLAAADVTVYKVSPDLAVIGEDRGALVSADYVAGELIVAYVPDVIFQGDFE